MNINWICKTFDELSPHELYSILRLRIEVFIVEQNCVFQDCDNKDQQSYHLCGWQNDALVAYARIMPPELSYKDASIGRVVNSLAVRRTKTGKQLMEEAMKELYRLFGSVPVTISAQFYLKNFYQSFGFVQTGNIYLEDGIDHIKMHYNPLS